MSRTLLEAARTAVRRTTNAFDGEIGDLVNGALKDMRRRGIAVDEAAKEITVTDDMDPLVLRCVMLYTQFMFGMDGDVDKKQRLERIYNDQCTALALATEYNGGTADG